MEHKPSRCKCAQKSKIPFFISFQPFIFVACLTSIYYDVQHVVKYSYVGTSFLLLFLELVIVFSQNFL